MRGDSGVAGEGRVVGVPKFHSWSKCIMPLTNINSDWMSNASFGLWIILGYIIYAGPLSSDSGRLTFLKGTARSQEWLVLRATNAHQTMSRWLLFTKNRESLQTNRL